MADGTVDNLNIRISSDAQKAVKSLNNLVSTLNRVNKSVSGLNTRSIGAFSSNINKLSTSLRSLNGLKVTVPNLTGLTRQLNSLIKVDFSKISSASKPLRELSSALSSLNGVQNIKIDSKNINSAVNAIKKLNNIDPGKIQKVSDGIDKLGKSFQTLSQINFNDNGLNKTINAINRLLKVDLTKFSSNDFQKITSSIASLSSIPDVSSNITRFISAIAKLANAGIKTSQTAKSIYELGVETAKAAVKLNSIGKINDDVNLFVQSIGRLANAGKKTSQTASGLQYLAQETLKFFRAMQNAPKINKNTLQMVQALAQLASAGGRVGTATNGTVSAFSKLANASKKTVSVLKKVSSAFLGIGNSSSALKQAQLNLSNLIKTAVGFRLGYGLLNFGKQAFEFGSDITEVENVVDVSFGNMSDMAYEFASTAEKNFGISELSALKFSGTLMAMFNSSGITQKKAAEMSTALTGLAGDLASFYNISQEDAFTKIRAGMSGQVMPLRQLGIDMTVASMSAYAMSQGITKSWQSMTQGEKQLLRYQYLLSVTSQQQGDFARTSWSWANQTRLLTLNLQSLAATLGQGLISAVLPAVTALNKLFEVLQKAALAVRNFFYVLTGYKGGSQSGVVDDMAGLGDAAEDLGDLGTSGTDAAGGLEDAAQAAEDLKNATLGIDELNIISPNEPASTGGTGGSGSGGGTGGSGGIDLGIDDGSFMPGDDEEKYVSPWAEAIRKAFLAEDWEELGEVIADGLNRGLQKVYDVINWRKVGPKITKFTKAFTKTFNSLADNLDFYLIGRTIGAGINTIVNTLNQLIDGIDWINLGRRFADGFNGLIDEVDWFELGRLITNRFMIAWDLLLGFVTDLEWGELGTALSEGINGAIEGISLENIGESLGLLVSGLSEALRNLFAGIKWEEIGQELTNGVTNFIKNWDAGLTAEMFSEFISGLLNALTGALTSLVDEGTFEELGQKIVDFICGIEWTDLLWDLSNFFLALSDAFMNIPQDFAEGFARELLERLFGDFTPQMEEKFKEATQPVQFLWNNLFSGMSPVTNAMTIVGTVAKVIQEASDEISGILGFLWDAIKALFTPAVPFFTEIATQAKNGIENAFRFLSSWFTENVKNPIVNTANSLKDGIESALKKAYDTVTGIWNNIGSFFKGIANKAIKPINSLVGGIVDGINWVGDKLGVGSVISGWKDITFASGSDGVPRNMMGIVNDQKGATYKELILPPNGKPFIPKGRNVMLPLQKGTKIMPAGQTEEFLKLMKIHRFAGGIGDFFGGAWDAIKNFAGDVWHYLTNPGDLVKIAIDKFVNLSDFFEPWLTLAGGAINTLFDSITNFVSNLFDKATPEVNYNPSAGVEQWRELAAKALHMTGQYSESNLNLLLYQMQTESGGNPNAINNWDINAQKGTPSKGLMQVIDPTFRAYAYPGYDKNIYDPLSNILAAIRYTLSRYGSLANGWKGHGYAKGIGQITMADLFGTIPKLAGGGVVMPGQLFVANERGPELLGRYGNRTTVVNNDQVVTSVSSGVEKAVERQNAEMTLLLRQILETNQRILAKDTSNYIDGKRADSLLRRARSNSGYNFRPAGGTV